MGPVAAIAAAAATLFSSSVWSATETPASRSQANPLLDGSVIMETALGLAVIILLIFGLGWLLRRFGRLPTGSRGDISVIGGTSLGPRERAVLLQVGHTRLLVGVAPGRVQTLHVFDSESGSGQGDVADFDHELKAEIDGGPR